MNALALSTLLLSVILLAASGGGVFAWSVLVVSAALASAGLICSIRVGVQTERCLEPLRPGFEHIFAAAIAILALTLIPLPSVIGRMAGQPRSAQNARAAAALEEIAHAQGTTPAHPWFALSRNRAGTMRMAVLTIAVFGAAMLGASLQPRGRRAYLRLLLLLGTAIAVAGHVAQWRIPQGDTLWWIVPIPHGIPGPLACFVNRNHFAGFLAVLCPVALAFTADDLTRRRPVWALLSATELAVLVFVLLLTLSRGAYLAAAAGFLTTPLLFAARRRWVTAGLLLLAIAALAVAVWRWPQPQFQQRLASMTLSAEDGSLQTRTSAWRGCFDIWRSYPIVGAGANAFRTVYPQHRTTSPREYMMFAENEYAQALAEGGVLGLLLLATLALSLGWRLGMTGLDRAADDTLFVAGVGALVVAAAHATVEFALRNPLYAVTLASVVGAALPREQMARTAFGRAWPFALGLLLLLGLAPHARRMQQYDSPHYHPTASLATLSTALVWAPTAHQVWYHLGWRCYAERVANGSRIAERFMTQAAEYDPQSYVLWRDLGVCRLRLNDRAGARAAFARVRALRSWVELPPVPED